jgi:glycerophosphoryl diester phosphodiesterase
MGHTVAAARAPIVIAHRGASGYRPEHTLAAYALAIDMGADYIEPDLVATKDGVLVARHENEIGETTDVAEHPAFADRQTTKIIDGVAISGWFTEDFTLAELKQLRCKERIPALRQQNTLYDGRFPIPTLQEIIDLARLKGKAAGRAIGLYPETKHPSYFASIGLALEEALVALLHTNGYQMPDAPVYIQSFETTNLQRLRGLTDLRLIQLIDESGGPYDLVVSDASRSYAAMLNPEGMAAISEYAHGIGPHKSLLVRHEGSDGSLVPTSLIADAHAAGLHVHSWTHRNENAFLLAPFRIGDPDAADTRARYGKALAEYELVYALGVDGVFSDNPDTAIEGREQHLARAVPDD